MRNCSVLSLQKKYRSSRELFRENPKKSLACFFEIKSNLQDNYNDEYLNLKIDTFIAIGLNYQDLSFLKRAELYYKKALKLSIREGKNEKLPYIYTGFALICKKRDRYRDALNYYLKCLKCLEESDRRREITATYNNLGIIYRILKEDNKAFKFLNMAHREAVKINDINIICSSLVSLSSLYVDIKKPELALEKCLEAYKYKDEIKELKTIGNILNCIGRSYGMLGKLEKSAFYLDQAISIFEERRDFRGLAVANFNYSLAAFQEKDLTKCLLKLSECKKQAEVVNFSLLELKIEELLGKVYEEKENYKEALKCSKRIQEIKDKIYHNDLNKQIEELKESYKLKEKEKEKEIYRLKNIELVKINHELEKANDTKSKLFSIIAHDVRNPLSSIIGIADLIKLLTIKVDNEKLNKYTTILHESALKLHYMISGLLEWSLSQSNQIKAKPDFNSLKDILNENISINETFALKKGISIRSSLKGEHRVFCDKDMISTVIRNILSNAIKFSFNNSTIIVDCKTTDIFEILSITDSGMGMEQEQLDKLFSFSETKVRRGTGNEKGTGLGLSLCFEFIKRNNGKIKVVSKPGKGSRFEIYLSRNKF